MAPLEHEGSALGHIHWDNNRLKHEAYWIGFLQGVLASSKLEELELPSLRLETERFAHLIGDDDATELLRDLDTAFDDYHGEIYSVLQSMVESRLQGLDLAFGKGGMNGFYGFCAGIACDNRITLAEVERLLAEIGARPELLNDGRILGLRDAALRAIQDRQVTAEESDDIASWIARLVGDSAADTGVASFGNMPVIEDALRDHAQVVFSERIFVVTGTFAIAPRKVIASAISDRGGLIATAVTKKTSYLVFGSSASRDWVHSHEGKKIIRARQIRDELGSPHLVDEPTFKLACGELL